MASLKSHRSSWNAQLGEKFAKEERRLHARLEKTLRQDLASLLESGAESDVSMPYVSGELEFHSCLIRMRLPKLWEVLQNETDRIIVCESTEREQFLQILRYIYTEDDLDPVSLTVNEIINTVSGTHTYEKTATQADSSTDVTGDILHSPPEQVQSTSSQNTPELSHPVECVVEQVQHSNNEESLKSDTSANHREVRHISSRDILNNNQDGKRSVEGEELRQENRKVKTYCQLGRDLLNLYYTSVASNVKLTVKDTCLNLQRCILFVRSSYFRSMLGGQWRESEALEINLEGIQPAAMCQALVYIYGGIPDVNIDDSNLIELVTIADMYGLDGLKDIIGFRMKQSCHFFHKPCSDCIPHVISTLPTAEMFGLDDIWEKGLSWCSRYIARVWSAKQFANLPSEIQEKCLQATIADITNESVIDKILECDCVGGSLTSTRRSEPIIAMAAKLMDACIDHLRNNLVEITQMEKFLSLGNHMALSLEFLEGVFCRAIVTMPTNKACATYVRVWQLCKKTDQENCPWTEDFKQMIQHMEEKCEHFMRLYINQLINTSDWKNMLDPELQERIKEGAWYVCVGDGRRLRGPPKAASYHERSVPTHSRPRDGLKTLLTSSKRSAMRSSSAAAKKKEDREAKASRPKRLSSLPQSHQDDEAESESCTFKAVKMANDVLTSPTDVRRVKPIVRKSSSKEPDDQRSSERARRGERCASQTSGHNGNSPLKSFPSSGATVNTSLVTPSSSTDDSEAGDVFSSPEQQYVLIPPTVVQSLEVEAIDFLPEKLVPLLRWEFSRPHKS